MSDDPDLAGLMHAAAVTVPELEDLGLWGGVPRAEYYGGCVDSSADLGAPEDGVKISFHEVGNSGDRSRGSQDILGFEDEAAAERYLEGLDDALPTCWEAAGDETGIPAGETTGVDLDDTGLPAEATGWRAAPEGPETGDALAITAVAYRHGRLVVLIQLSGDDATDGPAVDLAGASFERARSPSDELVSGAPDETEPVGEPSPEIEADDGELASMMYDAFPTMRDLQEVGVVGGSPTADWYRGCDDGTGELEEPLDAVEISLRRVPLAGHGLPMGGVWVLGFADEDATAAHVADFGEVFTACSQAVGTVTPVDVEARDLGPESGAWQAELADGQLTDDPLENPSVTAVIFRHERVVFLAILGTGDEQDTLALDLAEAARQRLVG